MRLFISIPLPPEVILEIQEVQNKMRLAYGASFRFIDTVSNAHITVEFLGDVTQEEIAPIQDSISYQTNHAARLRMRLDCVDAFPSVRRPESLVVTVKDANGKAMQFKSSLHEELALKKFSTDFKNWRPHITLGRRSGKVVSQRIDGKSFSVRPLEWTVNEVNLIQSQLTPNGSIYTILSSHGFTV